MAELDRTELVGTTAQIVSAYLASNAIPVASIAEFVANVGAAVGKLAEPVSAAPPPQVPAVNPKRSVHGDYIISLEDGARYKSLKRHLMTKYGMTPADYRAKWDLPRDYPMVAPNYSVARSALAKAAGQGRKAEANAVTTKPRRKSAGVAAAPAARKSKQASARKPGK